MANPTGDNVVPVDTPITAAAWTRIDNPNMAYQVDLTCPADIYVRYEQFQPAPALTGFPVWANTYYGYRSNHWLGWDKRGIAYIPDTHPTFSPVWVRLQAAGAATVTSNWIRE